ncbi:MAG: hypothetical protein ABH858_01035 [Candidatus Omnitrophota bacterium]
MNKVHVNLCPYENKEENKVLGFVAKYIQYVFFLLVLLVIGNILIFITTSTTRLPLISLEKTWKNLSSHIDEIDQLKKQKEVLAAEKKSYEGLRTNDILFHKIFISVFDSMPMNVWLQTARFDNNSLDLIGYVVRWQEKNVVSLDGFIKNLKSNDYFKKTFNNITLKSSRKRTLGGRDIIEFRIECNNEAG